ncbi:hypothetical protein [Acidiplasma sp.]|uniref:hypothetical protein n=1 Tax=Acidiplasma sp. TaxID=1872114 RepID=UPI00258E55B6|nr:hypothetical protein [Acidiplasma sp.]
MPDNSMELIGNSRFKEAVNTQFARLLIENHCPENLLKKYFIQDYFFVLEDIKVLNKLIDISNDNYAEKFRRFKHIVENDEIKFFTDFVVKNNINSKNIELSTCTKEYINFMDEVINSNDFVLILSMLLAGEWIYLETFSNKNSQNDYINTWEKLHSEDLRIFVNFMIDIINNENINDKIINVFKNTVELEIKFFCQFLKN